MSEHNLAPSEVQALRELQKQGLREIEGQPVQDLLNLAQRRQQSLEDFRAATKAFQEGLQAGDETKMTEAYHKALVAITGLEGLAYPAVPFLAARREARDADVARVKVLLETIDAWWWRRVLEKVAEFYGGAYSPAGWQQAPAILNEAKRILAQWPGGDGPAKREAQHAVDEMEAQLTKRDKGQAERLLAEAKGWVDSARAIMEVPAGSNASEPTATAQPPQHNPFVAVQCLVQAEALLSQLERESGVDFPGPHVACLDGEQQPEGARPPRRNSDLTRQVSELRGRIDELRRQWLHETASDWLVEERRSQVETDLQKPLRERLRQAGDNGAPLMVSQGNQQAEEFRSQLDKLIMYLRLDPGYFQRLDPALHQVVAERVDNRYQSLVSYSEARRLWDLGPEKRRPYLYTMHKKSTEALSRMPDDEKIQRLAADIEPEWKELSGQMEKDMETARGDLSEIERDLDELTGADKREGTSRGNLPKQPLSLGEIETRIRSIRDKLARVEQILGTVQQTLESQFERPPEWGREVTRLDEDFTQSKKRLEQLGSIVESTKWLVTCWNHPEGDWRSCISETKRLIQLATPPGCVKRAAAHELLQALRGALPIIQSQRPSLTQRTELTSLLWLLRAESDGADQTVSLFSSYF
jgi:hypothetical protein